jgi:transposase-like protein
VAEKDPLPNKLSGSSEAEVLLSKGASVAAVCRKVGVTDVTFYRRRKLYGGMQVYEAERMKELEKENARLKKLVADLSTVSFKWVTL